MGGLVSSLGLGHGLLEKEWGEEEARGSLEGLGAPGRQEGTGRSWLGPRAWQGKQSGVSPRGPFLGAPGADFPVCEKYCEKNLQGRGRAQAWGGRQGGAEEALLMLLCLADFQGADDGADVLLGHQRVVELEGTDVVGGDVCSS